MIGFVLVWLMYVWAYIKVSSLLALSAVLSL